MSKGISRNQEAILGWMEENSGRLATATSLLKVIPASRPSLSRALGSLEKRSLIRKLGAGSYQLNSLGKAPEGVFVGRQRELAELTKMLEDALTGQGRLAMLVREPGIGKTRTAQELAALATRKGAQVLWGRCHSAQGAPPYWPWVQAIRSYVGSREPDQLRFEMGEGAARFAPAGTGTGQWPGRLWPTSSGSWI